VLEFRLVQDLFQGKKQVYQNRFIYEGRWRDSVVFVKFTRSYCPELHYFCAERGHAPRLLGYGTVPGVWHVVVMEDLDEDPLMLSRARLHLTKWKEDLTKLVRDFHNEGLVHGDLRDANFTISKNNPEQIKLFDFDWGGRVGEASFPTKLLNEELTGGKKLTSLKITKEHDNRVLLNTLDDFMKLRWCTVPESEPGPMLKKPRKEY